MKKAVVLLSGGIDSAVVAALAKSFGFFLYALTFDYGQINILQEVQATGWLVKDLGIKEHEVVFISFPLKSPLTGAGEIPRDRVIGREVAPTYVPMRNTIFLSYAAAYAEMNEIDNIFIGVHQVDYSGYPDCRPPFIHAMEAALSLGGARWFTGAYRLKVHAPLLEYGKTAIISLGAALKVNFAHTWSCYSPTSQGLACGRCDSCQIRLKAFKEAGMEDPVRYANG